jgi:hypothetical protein
MRNKGRVWRILGEYLVLRDSKGETISDVSPERPSRASVEGLPDSADRRDKYRVIGAGSARLLAARSLAHYGISYDQVEKDGDVGGIWNIDKS